MISLDISIDLKDKNDLFFKSLEPELREEFPRSKINSKKDDKLYFEIIAKDKTACRASLNSILKPLILFKQLEVIE
jgi:tRNA threonylcarbamoyladenosine modification (KEOPS) complex  Pcc1 subunit